MPCICACNNMYYYLLTSSGWHRENYAKIYFIKEDKIKISLKLKPHKIIGFVHDSHKKKKGILEEKFWFFSF